MQSLSNAHARSLGSAPVRLGGRASRARLIVRAAGPEGRALVSDIHPYHDAAMQSAASRGVGLGSPNGPLGQTSLGPPECLPLGSAMFRARRLATAPTVCECLPLIPPPPLHFLLWLECAQAEGDLILVAGATGGVGQLVTAKLLEVREQRAGRRVTRAADANIYAL